MSLIESTGIYNKLNTCIVLFVIGGIAVLLGGFAISIIGCLLIVASLYIGKVYIKCPQCGCNWLIHFLGITKADFKLSDLYKMEKCPNCNLQHNKAFKRDAEKDPRPLT